MGPSPRLGAADTGINKYLMYLAAAVGGIAGITLVSRLFGFIRTLAQAKWVGAGVVSDAYGAANLVPNVLYEVVVGGSLASVVIPLLAIPLAQAIKKDVNRISSALLTWVVIVLTLISVLVFLSAPLIAQAIPLTSSASADLQIELLTRFLQIFAWQIPFYGISAVLTGVLQAHRKFFWPAFAPLLSSLVVISSYAMYGYCAVNLVSEESVPEIAIEIVGWGTTFGVIAMTLPLLIPVCRLGVKLRPCFSLPPGRAIQAFRLGIAGVGAIIAQQLSAVVVMTLTRAYGDAGTYTIFQFTQTIYLLPYAILAVPVVTAVFPHLSEQAALPGRGSFNQACASSTRTVVQVALVGFALLITLAQSAQVVFTWLNPVQASTPALSYMAVTLVAMAPGLVGYALIFHVSRALYAIHAGKSALVATALGWLGVCGASTVLVHIFTSGRSDGTMALIGVGIGQSFGMILAGVGLLLGLRLRAGREAVKEVWFTSAVYSVPAVIVAVVGWYVSGLIISALPGLAGALVAALVGVILIGLVVAVFLIPMLRRRKLQ